MIRINLQIDVNRLIEDVRRWRDEKRYRKRVSRCVHLWTLYPDSPYSICNKCQGFISTSTLKDLPAQFQWLIRGVVHEQRINAKKGNIIVESPVNDKRAARALLSLQIARVMAER